MLHFIAKHALKSVPFLTVIFQDLQTAIVKSKSKRKKLSTLGDDLRVSVITQLLYTSTLGVNVGL